MNTIIYIKNARDFKVVERGDIGTIDLLNALKTLKSGFVKNAREIDNGEKTTTGDAKLTIIPVSEGTTDVTTGSLKAKDIASCLEQLMIKYAREIVGEVKELQGILKGKDLERYLDQMIAQNEAKGNKNN